MVELDTNLEKREPLRGAETKASLDVNLADPQNALKPATATDSTNAAGSDLFSEPGIMNIPDIFQQTNAEQSSIATKVADSPPPVAPATVESAQTVAPATVESAQTVAPATVESPVRPLSVSPTTSSGDTTQTSSFADPFAPYSDATIQAFQTSDPTIANALSAAYPNSFNYAFNFGQPEMSSSGFAQFEQNVVANYNNYTPNGNLTENANNAAVLNSSLAGLSTNDAAAASAAITGAVNGPYSDSAIQSFWLSDRPIANALQNAEPDMTSQGFTQYEKNLASNYANAVDGTVPGTNADVMNNSTLGLSASDSAAASTAIQTALNAPYMDETLQNFEGSPTLLQTMSEAEPNMTLQGFTQFENNLIVASNAVPYGGMLNDAAAVTQATAGLSAGDASSANNAYASALNYSGQVAGYEPPPVLSEAPYSDTTTSQIAFFDPKLAGIISAAEPNMTPVGFGQLETDALSLYQGGNEFSPDNNGIITTAEQNLSASNRTAVQNALGTSSSQA